MRGFSWLAFLRQYGWKGPIPLLGAEPVPPYQRPPLSKAWLKREMSTGKFGVSAGSEKKETRNDA